MNNPYLIGVDVLGGAVALPEPPHVVQHLTSMPNAEGGRTVDGGGPEGAFVGGKSALVPFVEERQTLVERPLKSEIPGISDDQWTAFARAMKTADPGTVTKHNAYGMFALKPRRLADLGLVENVTKVNNSRKEGGDMFWECEWIAPLTEEKFLASPKLQYKAFVASMKKYVEGLREGSIAKPDGGAPNGMTLSGVLAVLHKCGPMGLKTWNTSERFETTAQLFEAANGIF